jgi:hypothetical protein
VRVLGRAAGVLIAVGALVSACRFEKRPDLAANQDARVIPDRSSVPPGSPVEDSARAVLVAMSDAFGAGDVARVDQLATPDVILFDQEERVRWVRSAEATRLPPALPDDAYRLGWHLVESLFYSLGPDAAFISLYYHALPSADPLPRIAVESWVLVRTDAGWRVRYLHRSRGSMLSGSPQP